MSGYLIIQWPNGDRRILDHIMSDANSNFTIWEMLEKYKLFFGDDIDWIDADQKDWLREHGFIT